MAGGGDVVEVLEALGDAEVGHLGPPVGVEQDVAGLDVAMHDARLVSRSERGQDVSPHPRHPFRIGRGPVDVVGQRLTGEAFHDEERGALVFARIEDGDHVGVDELGRRTGFRLEPGPHVVAGGQLRSEQLHGHVATEALVEAGHHVRHAAAAERLPEPVAVAQHGLRPYGHDVEGTR